MKLTAVVIFLCAIHAASSLSFDFYAGSTTCAGAATQSYTCDSVCDAANDNCTGGTCFSVGIGFAKCDDVTYDACLYADAACTTPLPDSCTNNVCSEYNDCQNIEDAIGLQFTDCPAPLTISNSELTNEAFCEGDDPTGTVSFDVDCFCCEQSALNMSSCLGQCYPNNQDEYICEIQLSLDVSTSGMGDIALSNMAVSGLDGSTVTYDSATDHACITVPGGVPTSLTVTGDFTYSDGADDDTLTFDQVANTTACTMDSPGNFVETDAATLVLSGSVCGVCCLDTTCQSANQFSTACTGTDEYFDGTSTTCGSTVCTGSPSGSSACPLNMWL